MNTKVHVEASATARLGDLGFDAREMRDVIIRGEMARDMWTPYHPRIARGQMWWAGTVYALRLMLGEHGWDRDDTRNLPVAISPNGATAIAVSSGDENTGRPDGPPPQTRNPKGTATLAAIAMNSRQLSLFDTGTIPSGPIETVTWILLVARDRSEIRFELSLPAAVGPDGRVTEWAERILFDPIPKGADLHVSPPEAEPSITVQVARKP